MTDTASSYQVAQFSFLVSPIRQFKYTYYYNFLLSILRDTGGRRLFLDGTKFSFFSAGWTARQPDWWIVGYTVKSRRQTVCIYLYKAAVCNTFKYIFIDFVYNIPTAKESQRTRKDFHSNMKWKIAEYLICVSTSSSISFSFHFHFEMITIR